MAEENQCDMCGYSGQDAHSCSSMLLDHLENLLARCHRDGGHYTVKHGLMASIQRAHEVIVQSFNPDSKPLPMLIWCPMCRSRHIDEGEFATKVHHTHSCQSCGLTWRPAVEPTVGVQFLPGFKSETAVTVTEPFLDEALMVLQAAASGEEIEVERARRFAGRVLEMHGFRRDTIEDILVKLPSAAPWRAAVERNSLTRAALAVLEVQDVHLGSRLVELAQLVSSELQCSE